MNIKVIGGDADYERFNKRLNRQNENVGAHD